MKQRKLCLPNRSSTSTPSHTLSQWVLYCISHYFVAAFSLYSFSHLSNFLSYFLNLVFSNHQDKLLVNPDRFDPTSCLEEFSKIESEEQLWKKDLVFLILFRFIFQFFLISCPVSLHFFSFFLVMLCRKSRPNH